MQSKPRADRNRTESSVSSLHLQQCRARKRPPQLSAVLLIHMLTKRLGAAGIEMAEPSSIAAAAAQMILERDAAGQAKYGKSMDRSDLLPGQWIQHAADALQYLLKLRTQLDARIRIAYQAGLRAAQRGDRTQASEDAIVRELLG